MDGFLDKAVKFTLILLTGLAIQHPLTFKKELLKLERQLLQGSRGSWGCPSIFAGRRACVSYDPNRYR